VHASEAVPDTIQIRAIEPSDRAALRQFYEGLSQDSLNRRFHGACRGIGNGTASQFCGPDHEHREGIVAALPTDDRGESRIVGHLCLEPTSPDELEMAVAVADDVRRQGIARALLAASIAWAQAHRIGHLRASMRWNNSAVIALVRTAGYPVAWSSPAGGGLEAIIDVGATMTSAA
jgi:GNAT superfamily N-acetyltransferase